MTPVVIHEVGLRDGLQMERSVVPLARKIEWAEAIADSGVDIVQLGSFVNPIKVPQMADTEALFEHFRAPGRKPASVILSALVLNEKGLERGLACGAQMFCMGVSASEIHSQKNTGSGIDEAAARVVEMARHARAAGKRVQVSVQSAFGCGFEGRISKSRVLGLVEKFITAGAQNISLADTAGHATPETVEELFSAVFKIDPSLECTCHLHNTYGLGLANCRAAMDCGVKYFETAIAGLGGCPFTKVAGGNVCTEDFVHYLRRSGVRREIDLTKLIEVAKDFSEYFGRELPGMVYKSGPIGYDLS